MLLSANPLRGVHDSHWCSRKVSEEKAVWKISEGKYLNIWIFEFPSLKAVRRSARHWEYSCRPVRGNQRKSFRRILVVSNQQIQKFDPADHGWSEVQFLSHKFCDSQWRSHCKRLIWVWESQRQMHAVDCAINRVESERPSLGSFEFQCICQPNALLNCRFKRSPSITTEHFKSARQRRKVATLVKLLYVSCHERKAKLYLGFLLEHIKKLISYLPLSLAKFIFPAWCLINKFRWNKI